MEKASLRKTIRQAIAALDEQQKKSQSSDLSRKLCKALAGLSAGSVVMCYAALDDEIDISAVVTQLRARGIRTVFPLVCGLDMQGRFVADSTVDMQRGYQGIYEPTPDTKLCEPTNIDIILVPGVAFDSHGGRLGRGKGFYDRYLPRALQAQTIGCGFRVQKVEQVPREAHDYLLSRTIFSCP